MHDVATQLATERKDAETGRKTMIAARKELIKRHAEELAIANGDVAYYESIIVAADKWIGKLA